jgi:hypothetical protein
VFRHVERIDDLANAQLRVFNLVCVAFPRAAQDAIRHRDANRDLADELVQA